MISGEVSLSDSAEEIILRKSSGYNNRTRRLFRVHPRKKGLRSLRYLLNDYEEGEKVSIIINPSIHKGRPHRRFQGKTGTIVKKQGNAYVVSVRDGKREKFIIALPQHLRKSN